MRREPAILAVVIVVAILATFGMLVWRSVREYTPENLMKPRVEMVDLATVVTQVRNLNRLETASMHVVHVGTITQSYKLVPNALGGDQLTFLAVGDVIAGVDLAQMKTTDVWRDPDGTVNLRIPPAQILVSRIDNRESRVLSRNTGVFRREDPQLEGRMREHAETAIRQEAMRKGIVPLAATNAETRLAAFVHTLGVQRVRFFSASATPRL